jgi:tetratricopeptide (TPR) repeat protein
VSDSLLQVFISYARTDSASFVDTLEADLKQHAFHPWVDRHSLQGGVEYMEMIQEAIDQCLALIVVMSPAAVQSRYVRMEYRYAAAIGKLVIPALHLPTSRVPIDLHTLEWADFHASYQHGLDKLVQALSGLKLPVAPAPAEQSLQPTPAKAASLKTAKQLLRLLDFQFSFQDKLVQLLPLPGHSKSPASSKMVQQLVDEGDARYAQRSQEPLAAGEALVAYEQALQLDPNSTPAWNGKGNALRALHRYEEALAAYEQATRLGPAFASAYHGKGITLYSLQRYEEALEAFEQAIHLNPDEADTYAWKGYALKALGRIVEAEQARQKARELGG